MHFIFVSFYSCIKFSRSMKLTTKKNARKRGEHLIIWNLPFSEVESFKDLFRREFERFFPNVRIHTFLILLIFFIKPGCPIFRIDQIDSKFRESKTTVSVRLLYMESNILLIWRLRFPCLGNRASIALRLNLDVLSIRFTERTLNFSFGGIDSSSKKVVFITWNKFRKYS